MKNKIIEKFFDTMKNLTHDRCPAHRLGGCSGWSGFFHFISVRHVFVCVWGIFLFAIKKNTKSEFMDMMMDDDGSVMFNKLDRVKKKPAPILR